MSVILRRLRERSPHVSDATRAYGFASFESWYSVRSTRPGCLSNDPNENAPVGYLEGIEMGSFLISNGPHQTYAFPEDDDFKSG